VTRHATGSQKTGNKQQPAAITTGFPLVSGFGDQGAAKKRTTGDPRGGWVGQRPKKGQGRIFFLDNCFIFYRVFELPSPRNAQKRDKTKSLKKNRFWIFGQFFVKTFQHDFFCKTFFVVFLNSHR
jgi:hypothetical protein